MKHLLLTTITAVVLVGCATTQHPELIKSLRKAAIEGNIESAKQAIAAGADVNAKNHIGRIPLHGVTTKEIAELLIAEGADVNAKDRNYGNTPLHYAAFKGHKEILKLLIAKGADVNAESENGVAGDPISVFLVGGIIRKTPLDVAIMRSHTEIADLLRKHGGKTGEELKAEGK